MEIGWQDRFLKFQTKHYELEDKIIVKHTVYDKTLGELSTKFDLLNQPLRLHDVDIG
jgi:hypothetical protein